MGSFDYTCAISGLPIGAGDGVRYLLLTQNPYHRGKSAAGMTCYPTDVWFPRTFPLRGKYNDYGRVEQLQTGPQADAWAAGFKVDMIEKGWGGNTCHDVPAKKGMPLSDLLEAVHEGRVHVRQNVGRRLDGERVSVPKGIPTRRRVEQALVKAGFPLSESYGKGAIVNRVDANTVRVRVGEYGERADRLTKIRDVLAGRPSIIIRPELYVTAAALASALCAGAAILALPRELGWTVAALAGFALRGGAIHFGLALPAYGREND
mgnify:CR=1 FL=1